MPAKRRAHQLTSTVGTELPSRLILLAVESEREILSNGQIKYTLKSGYAAHYRSRRGDLFHFQSDVTFHNHAGFVEWCDGVCKSKAKTILVCHSLNHVVAVLNLFEELQSLNWQLKSWFTKGATNILEFRKDTKKLVCLDSRNFFNDTLENLASELGIETDETDDIQMGDSAVRETCKRDVRILYALWQSWITFLSENDLGSFKNTLASTAFNSYRYRFNNAAIYIHDNAGSLLLERESYRGGRTEARFIGKRTDDQFYLLDVNSMYGAQMFEHAYPCSFLHYAPSATLDTLARQLERHAVIAEVDIETDEPAFAFKPTRAYLNELLAEGRINENTYKALKGRTTFPIGHYRIVLATPELLLATQKGWVKKVHRISVHCTTRAFRDYVDFFWNARLQYQRSDNRVFARIAKLFTNTLYGKFGQRDLSQEKIGECAADVIMSIPDYNLDTGVYSELVYLGGIIYRMQHGGDGYHSYPAIAAHVTSYARMRLYELSKQAPIRSIYYSDTDSFITDQRGMDCFRYLVDPDSLGALRLQHTSSWLQINDLKDYAMEGHERHKGIQIGALEVGNGKYAVEDREGLRSMLKYGYKGYGKGHMRTKQLTRQYRGGIVRSDGWVDPFVIG